MRQRVVLVSEASGGGVGKHVLDLAERLPSHGFDVLLLCALARSEHGFRDRLARHRDFGYRVDTIDVERAPGLRDIAGTAQLRRAILEFGKAHILHGHSSKAGALSRLGRWGRARHVLYTPHAFYTQNPHLGAIGRRLYSFIEYGLSVATDRIISVSRDEYEHARGIGISPGKLVLIENGIVLRSAAEVERMRVRTRHELGVGEHDLVVGFVGRLAPQKAPDVALRTFRLVVDAHPGARMVLAGNGPDADMMRTLIGQLGLAESVRWIPEASGPQLMPAFDIFLLTSRYEGFPYVLLEALDSGCAIVSTRVGGAADTVLPGENGALVDPPSPERLAAAVLQIARNSDLLGAMRRRSRAHANAFSIDRMVARTVDLYRSLNGTA